MKELFIITGSECEETKEFRPFVELFEKINQDVKVIEIDIHKDAEKVRELLKDRVTDYTPGYVSVIDGNVKRIEHGQICENRLLNMFSDKEYRPTDSDSSPFKFMPTEEAIFQSRAAKKLVEEGLVKDGGMPVTIKPYFDKLTSGQEIDLDDVKDIFLFLFTVRTMRNKGWELPENLSNARIMWQLHGGDPAFKWSHKIVQDAIDNRNIPLAGLGPDYISPDQFVANGEQY